MPGVVQHTRDSLRKAAHEAVEAGVGGLILFGIPAVKDAPRLRRRRPGRHRAGGAAPTCAPRSATTAWSWPTCAWTSTPTTATAACSPPSGEVDNDATLERYASIAVAQARPAPRWSRPSGMMDGQVGAIRAALDGAGFATCRSWPTPRSTPPPSTARSGTPPSARRSSATGRPTSRTRRARSRRRCARCALDVAEGADAVMVKPALAYLDVVARVARRVDVPVAAYQVSGEYAMVEAAAANGWIDRDRIITGDADAIRRAGADMVLTYWATEVAAAPALTSVGRMRGCGIM